jgi:hypothetical protein
VADQACWFGAACSLFALAAERARQCALHRLNPFEACRQPSSVGYGGVFVALSVSSRLNCFLMLECPTINFVTWRCCRRVFFAANFFLAKRTGMCIAVSYLRKPSSTVRSSWFVRPSHRRPLSGVRSPLTHDVYQEPTMNTRRNEFGELPKT